MVLRVKGREDEINHSAWVVLNAAKPKTFKVAFL